MPKNYIYNVNLILDFFMLQLITEKNSENIDKKEGFL